VSASDSQSACGDRLEADIRAALQNVAPAARAAIYDRHEFLIRWLAEVNPECGTEFVAFIARTAEP
jgi:hypothetical protein